MLKKKWTLCSLLISGLISTPVMAVCVKVNNMSYLSQAVKDAGYTAAAWGGSGDGEVRGKLGLPGVTSVSTSASFQPAGTLLASSVVSFVPNGRTQGFSSNQIIYRCTADERGKIFEFYATNGDDTYGGMNAVSGMQEVYNTYAANVGTRLTNLKTGDYYSRYWKSRPIPDSDTFNDGTYIYIPASAFSDVMIELIKTDVTAPNTASRYSYGWGGPLAYIAFKGGGASSGLFDGADARTNYNGWNAWWPGGWSLFRQTTIVRGASCRIKDYPSIVLFPTINTSELMNGGSRQEQFTIGAECEIQAVSGTASGGTPVVAMGLMVSQPSAVSAAQKLGLTTTAGGVTWLLDNNYGVTGVASGVGIRISSNKLSGGPINLLPDWNVMGLGESRGWYGYKDLMDNVSNGATAAYSGSFTASLEAIPGEQVTAGSVYAQSQVVISLQ